jgi:multidrug efflux pump
VLSRFFIDRPIFAAVLSIVTVLAGLVAVFTLPLAQFPAVTPPTVQVTANYPGASAQDVAEAVAAPIEQQVNGVEGMMFMSSQCANDGSYNLTVTFRHGIDLNMAQVLVQNRVSLALPQLPDVIKQAGVTTRKRSPDILMGFALTSPDSRYDQLYLSNYAMLQVRDELTRVPGVSDVFLLGQRDYSMRIWLDPGRLAARNLTAGDVIAAIREQNVQVAAGSVGQPPLSSIQTRSASEGLGSPFQLTLSTLGRLSEAAQFEKIILRALPDGRMVRLGDVARVELGAKNHDVNVRFDGQPTVFLAVFQMPDANALDVHDRVVAKMEELKQSFPDGVDYDVPFDTAPYTSESIREVFKTLRDAILLVAAVVLLFLQNWRSALIPLVAVPVAIIGTFAVMAVMGFSLNNLTLFGLVLAIGIVVDDAIVVVEAVEHYIEQGLGPREASIKAMAQVSGPVIAVGLVLSAVFIPCAFISGITGMFFRQFALTIAVSTIISAFNSLTLSPALTALLLRPQDKEAAPPLPWLAFPILGGWLGWQLLGPRLEQVGGWFPVSVLDPVAGFVSLSAPALAGILFGALLAGIFARPLNRLLGRFFRAFNIGFSQATTVYTHSVGLLLRGSVVVLVVYGGLLALTYWDFARTPKGFIPSQDMGYLLINVQLPDSASTERSNRVMRQLEDITHEVPGISHVTTISGQSFVLNAAGSNFGSVFIGLKDYAERRDPSLSSDAIANTLRTRFAQEVPDGMVAVFGPPPVRGVGRAGGFALMVEDRGDQGPRELQAQTENLMAKGNQTPGLTSLFSVFRANVPQLQIQPDRRQCMKLGVSLRDFADTLSVFEGSLYVNDFNLFGRTWQVIVQAESPYRRRPEDLVGLKVRSRSGVMVPVGSLAGIREVNGPLVLTRYNMYPAAAINGGSIPGVSSGEAIALMERLAKEELPASFHHEWTDMSYLELLAGNTAMALFGFAVVMVFLVLAAQYESWSLPLAIILVVPMCLLSAIVGVRLANMDINIFTQVGFVVLVGLASKNAVLIVEFAKKQHETGTPRSEATLEACRLRLRPIIMTSLAFILGVVPLLLSHGAGFEMRRTLGTAVFSGMIGVTAFGIFLTPVFFFVIDWLGATPVFASRLVGGVSGVVLGAISLAPVRRYVARSLRSRQLASTTNGTARAPAGAAQEKRPVEVR